MAKSKAGTRRANTSGPRKFISGQRIVLKLVAVASVIGLIAAFHRPIFEAIGFSLVLWLLWGVTLIFIVWRRKWRSLPARWNIWLATLILTISIWGVLALFQPSELNIMGVDFSKVSLGGNSGKYLIGNQDAGLAPAFRLTLLILGGIVLFVPRPSLSLLILSGYAARTVGLAVATRGSLIIVGLGQQLAQAYGRHRPHRALAILFVALMQKVRSRPSVELDTQQEAPVSGLPLDWASPEPVPVKEQSAPRQSRFVIEGKTEQPLMPVEASPRPNGKERGQLPPIDLLDKVVEADFTEADNDQRARLIEKALDSYGVEAKVVQINPGPSVTQFGVEPGWDRKYKRMVERDPQGRVKLDRDGNAIEKSEEISRTRVKVERITSLSQNLALALAVHSIRFEAPVPGKPLVGIEVPNSDTSLVLLKSVIESPGFRKIEAKSKLSLALGTGAAGEAIAADLAKMPHLLIAGTTGSGKTVFINSIVTCLLMHNRPQDLRLLLIDPKRVELVQFDGIPHLISPVVKEVDKAVDSLRRAIKEMDNRYKEFAAVGVRNIEGYNRSPLITETLPYIVIIVDELNQLMMSAADVVEASICRLAQLSRATGIHLMVATQRPSVDVVTGLIKANFPTRISFTVPSLMDSRTILDVGGAEKLLGMGDMLYLPSDVATPKRLRGCFVSDNEIDKVVRFWKQAQDIYGTPTEDTVATAFATLAVDEATDEDSLLPAAKRLAKDTSHISTSLIQRRLHVGYPRAARIMDSLEREGLIVRSDPGSPAEVIEADEEEE